MNRRVDKEIFVAIGEFDSSKVVIEEPTSFQVKGKENISVTQSDIFYLNDKNEKCTFYLGAEEQTCFGVNRMYDMQKKVEIPENIVGYQICYPMTSMKTIDEPTENEKYMIETFDALRNLAIEEARKESVLDALPDACKSLLRIPEEGVKPIYAPKKQPDPLNPKKKKDDLTKPKRAYIKLISKGGDRVITSFYGPGDVKESPLKYLDQRGKIKPCFKVDSIYWGAHASSAYGASVKLLIAEANYTPLGDDGVPKKRYLGKNTAPLSAEGNSYKIGVQKLSLVDDGEEESVFQTGKNPISAIKKKVALKENSARKKNDPEDDGEAEEEPEVPKKKIVLEEKKKPVKKKIIIKKNNNLSLSDEDEEELKPKKKIVLEEKKHPRKKMMRKRRL